MNAQKRDMVIATLRVAGQEGATLMCADCDNDAAPFSCYCEQCEVTAFGSTDSATCAIRPAH